MVSEIVAFVRGHWLHVLLLVPGALVVTFVHEAAHAVTVLLHGGTVEHIQWLPGQGQWGAVHYRLSHHSGRANTFIALAPYGFWLMLMAGSWYLSRHAESTTFTRASAVFVWMFVVPLADVANAVVPYLLGKENDIYAALGAPSGLTIMVLSLIGVVALAGGYHVQDRLYRARGLSAPAYLALSATAVLVIGSAYASGMVY